MDRANAFAVLLEAVRAAFERSRDECERQLAELAQRVAMLPKPDRRYIEGYIDARRTCGDCKLRVRKPRKLAKISPK